MTPQPVSFRQERVIEVARGIVLHAQPLHHVLRTMIGGHGERNNLGKTELIEAEIKRGLRSFGGVATMPVVRRESPADFNAGCEVRGKSRYRQPDGPDKGSDARHFHRPVAEAMLIEMLFDAIDDGITLGADERLREKLDHARIGVERREGLTIRGGPAPQEQAVGADFARQIRGRVPGFLRRHPIIPRSTIGYSGGHSGAPAAALLRNMPATAMWILAIALMVVGALGIILPALPGIPLMFAGMVVAAAIDDFQRIGWIWLSVLGFLTLLSILIEFAASAVGARQVGASRRAIWGALLGTVVGLFFGIPGLLLGPFIGAVIGELSMHGRIAQAGRVGIATWIGLIFGTLAKMAIAFAMLGIFVLAYLLG